MNAYRTTNFELRTYHVPLGDLPVAKSVRSSCPVPLSRTGASEVGRVRPHSHSAAGGSQPGRESRTFRAELVVIFDPVSSEVNARCDVLPLLLRLTCLYRLWGVLRYPLR
jgi:hypothetical protein